MKLTLEDKRRIRHTLAVHVMEMKQMADKIREYDPERAGRYDQEADEYEETLMKIVRSF